ncbi:hypothetical protein [Pectobacterium brasiliense]|uniref:hypothetical protein n=1 Tax=Pectobacterium brasiliense TaxID=180957 RepID=UPI00057F54C5|nr:hypothetical protein [Pectobacterium brasiliense]KHT42227.1 hypothetical protein RD02_06150 [Pectobacterium brasiliense]
MQEFEKAVREVLEHIEDQQQRIDFVNRVIAIRRMQEDEPCWCGSKKTVSNCHWKRQDARPMSVDQQVGLRVGIFKRKKICSATFDSANCETKNIVGAHTIQRSGTLKAMAEDGHVGSLYQQVGEASDVNVKRGVKHIASVFYGFCRKHDNDLFECLEKKPVALNAECLWASSYRSVCHEHYQKTAAIEGAKAQLDFADNGMPLPWQLMIQSEIRRSLANLERGLAFISTIKQRFEQISADPRGKLLGWLVTFNGPPKLAVSGTFSPFYSLDGQLIQGGKATRHVEHFAISTVMYEGYVAWIVACLPEQHIVARFLEQLFSRSHREIMAILSWAVFAWNENVYFPLSWWEGLSEMNKEELLELAQKANCTTSYENQTFPGSVINQHIQSIIPFPC